MNNTIKLLPNGDFEVIGRAEIKSKIPRGYVLHIPTLLDKARGMHDGWTLIAHVFGMDKAEAEALLARKVKYEIHGNRLTVF